MRSENLSCKPLSGRFFDILLQVNRPRLDVFKQWLFHPGMLFQARQQWWGKEESRATLHEGLDLCWFADDAGNRLALDHTTMIPAPFTGTVVKISRDFLGQSIFLVHDTYPAADHRLVTAFGHTRPVENLAEGQSIAEAEIIASVSDPVNRQTKVPPHLHLTLAVIPDTVAYDHLTWNYLGAAQNVTLLDPLAVFPTTFSII